MAERRSELIKKYNLLYHHVLFSNEEDNNYCFYCNLPADTIDHIPPISLIEDEISFGNDIMPILVPACKECNFLLNDKKILTLLERIEYINKMLLDRYRKDINVFLSWDEKEINRMGYNLKKMIKASKVLGRIALKRISYDGHKISDDEIIKSQTEIRSKIKKFKEGERMTDCYSCDGKGYDKIGNDKIFCEICNGSGLIKTKELWSFYSQNER